MKARLLRAARACLLTASLAAAQATLPPPPKKLALPLRVGVFGETPITLEETIAAVVENNRDIEVARLNTRIARLNVTAARGVYEPVFNTEARWRRTVTATASVILGGEDGRLTEHERFANPQVTWLSPRLGGSYTMDLTSSRLTTNNIFSLLNPQYPSRMTFTFTQPLLRGLRFDEARSQIEISRRNAALTEEQFRAAAIAAVAAAVQAYHELLFARRNLELQLAAVELGRRQVESNRRMVEQGLLAEIGIVEAETQLATFEQNAWTAQQAVTTAENELKELMLPDRASPLWATELVPVSPPRTEGELPLLKEAVAEALARRPELAQLDITAEINAVETRLARQAVLPQVDLFGTLAASGLAGARVERGEIPFLGNDQILERLNELSILAGIPPLPPQPDRSALVPPLFFGGYAQSLRNLWSLNYPTTLAGVRISIPLLNRGARASLEAARVEGRRIGVERDRAEQRIEAEVRNALQAVVTARGVLETARRARSLAETQYESEVRLFQAGISTVFLVLQRQNEMVTARGRALRAEIDVARAVAAMENATGRTLEAHGVTIDPTR